MTAPAPAETAKRGKKAPAPKLPLSGEPSVNLLPPSVRDRAVVRSRIRTGVLFVVLGAILAVALFAYATLRATQAQEALDAANNRTNDLLMEQGKYGEVMRIDALVAQIEELQRGVTAAEVDWAALFADLLSRLPEGAMIANVSFNGVEPWSKIPSAGEGGTEMIATVTLTLDTVTVPEATAYARSLSTLDGYAASTIESVAVGTDGRVVSAVTVSLTWGAETGRFGTRDDATAGGSAGTDASADDASGGDAGTEG